MLFIEQHPLNKLLNEGLEKFNLIDARSPSEFVEDHLPGAVNIPLLDDNERAIIGTIYKQKGSLEAKFKGVEIVSPKLPYLMNEIRKITENGKPTIIYCWRGGDRSESLAAFAKLSGLKVAKLKGGYRVFRKHIYNFFENELTSLYNPKFLTLYGPTGSGKTEILRKLKKEGLPVVDLENNAAHKGSSFGFIGEKKFSFITQKKFETNTWFDFYTTNFHSLYLIEGESKKIGKVVLPNTLFSLMNQGINILVEPHLNFRVQYTLKNYLPHITFDNFSTALNKIKKYIGLKKVQKLLESFKQKHFTEIVEILLHEYYDPLYKKSLPEKIDYKISYNSIEEGLKYVKEIFNSINRKYNSF